MTTAIVLAVLLGLVLMFTEGYVLIKPGFYWFTSMFLNLLAVGLGSGVLFFLAAIFLKILWS